MKSQPTVPDLYRHIADSAQTAFGADLREQRMAWYKTRPMHFALKVLGSRWWSAQEQVGNALVRGRRVIVRSGNGVGKSHLAADLALWFLYTHSPAIVVITAPTKRQVKQVIWREIHRRMASARKRLPGKLLQTQLTLRDGSYAIGVATESGVQFQGFHCENLLIIIDEASGVPDEIWDAAEGVAVGGNNKILAIGNPLSTAGRFYQNFKTAGSWTKLTINGLAHPNITGKGRRIPGCITADFIDEKVKDWCEPIDRNIGTCGSSGSRLPPDGIPTISPIPPINPIPATPDSLVWRARRYRPNDLFRTRILGEFPNGASDTLIPLRLIEAAIDRDLPEEGYRRLAADIARFGDDWTVIGMRIGPCVTQLIPIDGADTKAVASTIIRLVYSEQPSTIAVDCIGLGAGVVDNLSAEGIQGLDPVNVSVPAFNKTLFANRRAELYWGLQERFHKGDIRIPRDELLVEELTSIRYFLNARGQIQIESKAEMKKRVKRSPDRADMLALLFDNSYEAWAVVGEPVRPVESRYQKFKKEMEVW